MPRHYKMLTTMTLIMMGITLVLAMFSPISYMNVSTDVGFKILSATIIFLAITLFLTVLTVFGIFHHNAEVHSKKR